MTSTFPLYAAALGIDFLDTIQRETNNTKYRAAERQASYLEKERQRREEYNRTHFGG